MSNALTFNEDQRDCLQEICNVAMGQAGDSLARLLNVFINLSVPYIRLIKAEEVHQELRSLINAPQVSAVRQAFYSPQGNQGLCGESIVIFSDASFQELAHLMAFEGRELDARAEQELLLDISNVLNGACLNGIAQQLEEQLGYSAPSLIGQHIPVEQILDKEKLTWEHALSIKIGYTLENHAFQCDMLMLMPGAAISHLMSVLDQFLEDF
ncbi:histidine kinase [Motiliproteus sp. SC1-56]|uniref:histidine kinase n=1 Tax=Motiliproteus sp. SC1-56 TaxID=2799565 RepID=UPI001A8C10C1|nr:histidine kinase [Motiliproteus sp. SC1-56]